MEVVSKPWGWYKVMMQGDGYVVKELIIRPGEKLSLQYHEHRNEVWTCVKGKGYAQINNDKHDLYPGKHLTIWSGKKHRIVNDGTDLLHIFEVWFGDDLREDDIVRLEDNYGRVE